MPFDASLSLDFPLSPQAPAGRRALSQPLSLGVFRQDGAWKVYGQFDRAAAYANRELAVSAAEARALEAVRCGRRVELFIEEESGELRQAAIELH
jgi:hypothetical protein